MTDIIIREYAACDRDAVRRLACDTADRGQPVERFFSDREVFADLVTSYYTDHEPQGSWVAQQGGDVIGYLTGCVDTRRYQRLLARRVVPGAVARAVLRGTLWSRQVWRVLGSGLETWRRVGFHRFVPLARYPAHFHVNIREDFRRRHVGRSLVERFIRQASARGVPGVHAAVRADNAGACRFFERFGFTPLGRHPVVHPEGQGMHLSATIIYGKILSCHESAAP